MTEEPRLLAGASSRQIRRAAAAQQDILQTHFRDFQRAERGAADE